MADNDKNRIRKVKSILVTQEAPTDNNSPYFKLAEKYKIKVDFRPFIQVQVLPMKDFRKQRIEILQHTAVIFTSRHAVDFFFKICRELQLDMPAEMKYFCISEQTANYLQKYIVIRKRKIFSGEKTTEELFELIKKHRTENFLYPCSDLRKNDIPDFLRAQKIQFTEAIMYQTIPADLSDLKNVQYDVLAFFSPAGVQSLLSNFPAFKQNATRIAAFGSTTAKSVTDNKLILDIMAPRPEAPSMTMALEQYVKKANG